MKTINNDKKNESRSIRGYLLSVMDFIKSLPDGASYAIGR